METTRTKRPWGGRRRRRDAGYSRGGIPARRVKFRNSRNLENSAALLLFIYQGNTSPGPPWSSPHSPLPLGSLVPQTSGLRHLSSPLGIAPRWTAHVATYHSRSTLLLRPSAHTLAVHAEIPQSRNVLGHTLSSIALPLLHMPRHRPLPLLLKMLALHHGSAHATLELRWIKQAFLNRPIAPLIQRRLAGEPLQYILGTYPPHSPSNFFDSVDSERNPTFRTS